MRPKLRGGKIKPLGFEKAKELFDKHFLEFYCDYINQRACHCKICGNRIAKGDAFQFYYWRGEEKASRNPFWARRYPNADFLYTSHFGCEDCFNKLVGEKPLKCPSPDCNGKIEMDKQKKTEGNFFYCKDCGTVVYR